MHKFFTPPENINMDEGKIIGDDVKHIYKVLRLAPGEKIVLNNCQGEEYLGEIASISKTEVSIKILNKLDINNESGVEIYLFQGLPKAQKMDLIVQKGTELGIIEFIPTITQRVDVRLKGEFKKLDRLNRIALEAAKQSKRSLIPIVSDPMEFEDVLVKLKTLDIFFVPYENAENLGIKGIVSEIRKSGKIKELKKIGIMVGPEGGFEQEEIKKLKDEGAYIITLGSRILRTETAGFVATSLIQYELGDLGGIV